MIFPQENHCHALTTFSTDQAFQNSLDTCSKCMIKSHLTAAKYATIKTECQKNPGAVPVGKDAVAWCIGNKLKTASCITDNGCKEILVVKMEKSIGMDVLVSAVGYRQRQEIGEFI